MPMNPPPIALGLILCEKVIIEEGTRSLTLVSTFASLRVEDFPSPGQRFALAAALAAGRGEGVADLVITQLETDEEVYSVRVQITFSNPLAANWVVFEVDDCSFPAPGNYEAILLVDGDWVARRRFLVEATEEQP
jgi:hypothetical protein